MKKQDDLKLMPEREFGKVVTAITRVPKPKGEKPKADMQCKIAGRPNRDRKSGGRKR
jgi:hypothetical protein